MASSLAIFSSTLHHFRSSSSTTTTSTPSHKNPPHSRSSESSLINDLIHNFNSPYELRQLHAHVIKTNTCLSSTLSISRVASVCALTPSFSYAHKIFQQEGKSDSIVEWNSCLRAFAESDCPRDAIALLYQLRHHNVFPDAFTCSFVLKACTQLLDLSHGKIVHAIIEKLGLRSNIFLQNTLVLLYALCGAMDDASLLFEKMPKKDIVTWNIMITQLAKQKDVDLAYEVFLKMPERSVRSWTAMIAGFVQCGKPKDAISLFTEMEKVGMEPNEVTLVAVLAACADLGALDLGMRIHEQSDRNGYRKNVKICNTLIDMYIKCGCLEAAMRVFDGMDQQQRTVVSWSAMIHGLAMHGQAEKSLNLFSTMTQLRRIKPNSVTFIGLLHACSHMGLINEGRKFFASMTNDYGITPRIEHYGCMVDLFSRGGLLQEAHEFIKNMPIKPNSVIWGALLGGCKLHKNVELAEEVIKHLSELDPSNDGYYVVLSNIYADLKRWGDVARMRKMMRDVGVKKTPGWSSISVNGVVHEFSAGGDEGHPESEKIFEMWEEMLKIMKLKGYVPNTSVVLLDMEENEKVKVVCRHSEKLALVFGLMKTPNGGDPIRIMKNIRVCEDCHNAFKIISEIVDREIILGDRNRFHCFRQGLCSCHDYW
ncbi:pentatricopeptide repeat-containing protein At3g62890-like [Impatiens glandulifera]|uniref:pentatricopeptide repeat-containing protein At3g62890-like n=1 Tax=Impatiens glandulifera TaxID=253017 RepID=UPI001FB0A957|nr:pentatricopeptide repeat-containing protein At3g62890-like [Impatiens glandulifera]XP_047341801.1 pentatricopeptide repeat-containing protein At3g62890-like [Impatiens glandulifera]XP_047341802.1 pentatricopeptide repeat-containing protein At3g62890-like [Impatiens glandulifera]XP_047341803.1 pentatricopeptide repeat-containing protein At3g62890-like [Impatiens glandulifera]XP_047341804.1 pentatricopeptide repeat-containing protein At3g62890-like [Impatiens glandulifera]XP_047341805.1 penta